MRSSEASQDLMKRVTEISISFREGSITPLNHAFVNRVFSKPDETIDLDDEGAVSQFQTEGLLSRGAQVRVLPGAPISDCEAASDDLPASRFSLRSKRASQSPSLRYTQ